jgi:adenine-specific DNA-methyltransferase
MIIYLNSLKPKNGWIVKEYSNKRAFFTKKNAAKIQACRREIMEWRLKGWLNYDEHAVLLASLICSMDKIANTAGTYYAFLKTWHRKALIDFRFDLIMPSFSTMKGCCACQPAEDLVQRRRFDILYLDPPYNERSYAQYYHLPETIALEKTPKVHGLSGIPDHISTTSDFNRPKKAANALKRILDKANFRLLIFHYSDQGIISPDEITDILSIYGKIENLIISSNGYTTKKKNRSIKHHLYIVHNA